MGITVLEINMPLKDPAARKAYAKAQYEKNKEAYLARSKARRLRLQKEKALIPKPERIPRKCNSCGVGEESNEFPERGNKCKKCIAEYMHEYNLKNKQRIQNRKKEWREKNKEKKKYTDQKWAAENRLKSNMYKNNWNKKNAGAKRALDKKRLEAKRQRTPDWLDVVDHAEIEFTYIWCYALRNCGLDHHVDHIVPLQGNNVSGLHVPSNLQVIPAKQNLSKSNGWTDG